ncbi:MULTISPECIES: hypothetical protein [Moorena]|uniref:hypothetical protein n=1 Tax=Moorena TaxID=1155738 RepID=UPI0002FCA873|nr:MULTISPECIES: hypothetical protein [Moorena]NEP35494.1 hypothetical protein [Moorena sp. SIO3B2]NEQ07795.1 hypothetical protein [Moorena sp. SIO4E2]
MELRSSDVVRSWGFPSQLLPTLATLATLATLPKLLYLSRLPTPDSRLPTPCSLLRQDI